MPLRGVFPSAQLSRHSKASVYAVQGGLAVAQAGCRLWHHPHGAEFSGLQNIRDTGLWRLPPRLQRKMWKIGQCTPERVMHGAMSESRDTGGVPRNLECGTSIGETVGSKHVEPDQKRGHVGYSTKAIEKRLPFVAYIPPPVAPLLET